MMAGTLSTGTNSHELRLPEPRRTSTRGMNPHNAADMSPTERYFDGSGTPQNQQAYASQCPVFFPSSQQHVSGPVQQPMFFGYWPEAHMAVPMAIPMPMQATAMPVSLQPVMQPNSQPQNTSQEWVQYLVPMPPVVSNGTDFASMAPPPACTANRASDLSSTSVAAGMAQMASNRSSIAGGSVIANATQPSPGTMQGTQQLDPVREQLLYNTSLSREMAKGEEALRSAAQNEVARAAPGEQPARSRKTPHAVFVDLSGLRQKGNGFATRSQ
mmetsp:Transcript_146651/g.255861  ORF Transcript_146651/g.255861 Transcript_146651/m.255861 type:complete len:271 (+) Transcript_146651:120-932(+)